MCSVVFQVSNMFIMSLAVADLTVGCIVMPISSAYALTGEQILAIQLYRYVCTYYKKKREDVDEEMWEGEEEEDIFGW